MPILSKEQIKALFPYGSQLAVNGENRHLTGVEVARYVRPVIKDAVAKGLLPNAKYSVTSDHNHVSVRITNFPYDVYNREYVEAFNNHRERQSPAKRLTPAAQHTYDMVDAIIHLWHWDKSDTMTDYFNCAYYTEVNFSGNNAEWEAKSAGKEWTVSAEIAIDPAKDKFLTNNVIPMQVEVKPIGIVHHNHIANTSVIQIVSNPSTMLQDWLINNGYVFMASNKSWVRRYDDNIHAEAAKLINGKATNSKPVTSIEVMA